MRTWLQRGRRAGTVLVLTAALAAGLAHPAAAGPGRNTGPGRPPAGHAPRAPGAVGGTHRPPGWGSSGPWRRPFDGRFVPPLFRDLTDEQIEAILDFVREKMPWRYPWLKSLREKQPAAFRRVCRRLRFEIEQLKRLKASHPEAYEAALEERRLRARVAELAGRVRQTAPGPERDELTDELRETLGRLFDAETKARSAQIHELENRLRQLQEDLRRRAEHRDEVIEGILKRILEGKWMPPAVPGEPPPSGAKPPPPRKRPPS